MTSRAGGLRSRERRRLASEDAFGDALSVRLPISLYCPPPRRVLAVAPNLGSPRLPFVFELPENLDMPAAAPLAEALLKCVGEPLALDASRVGRLGGSCLQVLLSAARTWNSAGDPLTLQDPSPRFLEDLNLLGFAPDTFLTGVIAP